MIRMIITLTCNMAAKNENLNRAYAVKVLFFNRQKTVKVHV